MNATMPAQDCVNRAVEVLGKASVPTLPEVTRESIQEIELLEELPPGTFSAAPGVATKIIAMDR